MQLEDARVELGGKGGDPRVMAAMLQMTKIDIAELEPAYAAGA